MENDPKMASNIDPWGAILGQKAARKFTRKMRGASQSRPGRDLAPKTAQNDPRIDLLWILDPFGSILVPFGSILDGFFMILNDFLDLLQICAHISASIFEQIRINIFCIFQ